MIVKIQRPIEASISRAPALIYNQDRSYKAVVEFDDGLRKLMGDAAKIYAEVAEGCDGIEVIRVLPAQSW